jgi:hypothetical protein
MDWVLIMTTYHVNAEDYFNNTLGGLGDQAKIFSECQKNKDPINQLMEKYHLKNKNVLSIGGGTALEEYWLYRNGCKLTLVDIEKSREGYLARLTQVNPADATLTYFVEDASEYLQRHSRPEFDLIYFSGFAPDEIRRDQLKNEYLKENPNNLYLFLKRMVNYFFRKIFRKNLFRVISWRETDFPFMDLCMDLAVKNLKTGGLFISQSYFGGINYQTNPHAIDLVKKQFGENGMLLLKLYYWESCPSVSLTIGIMGQKADAEKYLGLIRKNTEISSFHGRGETDNRNIERVYDMDSAER